MYVLDWFKSSCSLKVGFYSGSFSIIPVYGLTG